MFCIVVLSILCIICGEVLCQMHSLSMVISIMWDGGLGKLKRYFKAVRIRCT